MNMDVIARRIVKEYVEEHYELTYNGDKKEWYLDAYKKFENRCIPMPADDEADV